jgi:hypothetical protein
VLKSSLNAKLGHVTKQPEQGRSQVPFTVTIRFICVQGGFGFMLFTPEIVLTAPFNINTATVESVEAQQTCIHYLNN